MAAQGQKVSESMSSDTHGMALSLYGTAGYEYGNGNNDGATLEENVLEH